MLRALLWKFASRIPGFGIIPVKLILGVYHACVLNLKYEPKFKGFLVTAVVEMKFESETKGVSPKTLKQNPLVTDSNFIITTEMVRMALNLGSHLKLSTHAWYKQRMSLVA